MEIPINYGAVIVAALINMVLGALWYSKVLFVEPWARMSAIKQDTKPTASFMAKNLIIGAITSLIMACVLVHALVFANDYMGTSGWTAGLMVGFLNWLGFVVPVTIGSVLWEGRPWQLWFINAGYYLVSLCLMGIVLGAWL